MKKLRVPIFTEEYKIDICIGTPKELTIEGKKLGLKKSYDDTRFRGKAYDCYPNNHPLIFVNGDLPRPIVLATLAHEASHAMDYVIEFIGLDDRSGEFRGHGIGAIMRAIGHSLKRK